MIDPKIVGVLDHPLASFGIAAALCLYHPFAVWSGKRIMRKYHERLADFNLMKQVRMLGSELSTISMAAMLKASLDPKSNLTIAINKMDHPQATWVFYAWLAGIYLIVIFTPSVFVRYGLLERERGLHEDQVGWSLFVWRWTLVSWLLGFVNLTIALKFMASH